MPDAALFNLLVQLLVLAAAGFVGCYIAERAGTARIVGGLIAGLIIGPSLLGKVAPETEDWLWRGTAEARAELAELETEYQEKIKAARVTGVTEVYLEIIAKEYEPRITLAQSDIRDAERIHRHRTLAIVLGAVVVILLAAGRHGPLHNATPLLARAAPIAIGAAVLPIAGALIACRYIRIGPVDPEPYLSIEDWLAFPMAFAISLAIFALPVSSRLLEQMRGFGQDDDDRRLVPVLRTAAAINTIVLFILCAGIVLHAEGGAIVGIGITGFITEPWSTLLIKSLSVFVVGLAATLAVAFFGLRLIRHDHNENPAWPVGLLFVAAMLPIVGAAYAGVPVALGALAAGLALGSLAHTPALIRRGFAHLADAIALPILCAYIGTRIDIVPSFDWLWVLVALILFGDGKATGAMLVGRYVCRLDWRASVRMGTILAAGGAVPLIVALMVYEAGVIDDTLFVALVIANAVTAALAAPTLRMVGAYFASSDAEADA